jgi:hypothetical protein
MCVIKDGRTTSAVLIVKGSTAIEVIILKVHV